MEECALSEQEPFSVQQAGRVLLRDFFLSFKVAQGSENAVQEQLFLLLRDKYVRDWGEARFPDIIAAHQQTIPSPRLKPPNGHGANTILGTNNPSEYASEFARVWSKFGIDLTSPKAASPYELGRLIIQKDAQYVLYGRPSTLVDGDRWGSLYRQHILMGEPIGSRNVDDALAQVRLQAAALNPKVQSPRRMDSWGLQCDWEQQHPGQQFYPDDLAYLVAKAQTPS